MLTRYRPRPYCGRVVLVLTADRQAHRQATLDAWRSAAVDGLEVHDIPTNHYSVIGPEHAAAVGAAVSFPN